jgi:predicted hydrocarbon binding protein
MGAQTRKPATLMLERQFDPARCRHTLDGETYVLHCHHYATLYTQLAEDAAMLDGKRMLAEVAEDTAYEVLSKYFESRKLTSVIDRIAVAEQYFAFAGMGQLKVLHAGVDSGVVELTRSHIDEGWVKKWGKTTKPVNHFTRGFIAGTFAAVFGRAPRTYQVIERSSIAMGADRSRFEVVVY